MAKNCAGENQTSRARLGLARKDQAYTLDITGNNTWHIQSHLPPLVSMEALVSVEDLSTLLDTLNQDDKPLEVVAAKFQKAFHKTDQFKAGCTLYVMIKDDLLSLSAKLAAYYILQSLYSSEPLAANPFLPCFIAAVQKEGGDNKTNTIERNFVCALLTNPKEVRFLPFRKKGEDTAIIFYSI